MKGKDIIQNITGSGMSSGRVELLAALPAFLMCLMTLAMTALDVFVPSMSDTQYVLYPYLGRIQEMISAGSFIAVLIMIRKDRHNGRSVQPFTGTRVAFAAFAGFALWIFISTCVNGFTYDAVLGVKYRCIGVFDILAFLTVYMYGSSLITSCRIRQVLLVMFLSVTDIIGVSFLYDWFTGSIIAFHDKNEPAAIFFHGNHYGYVLVMAILVAAGACIYGSRREMIIGAPSMVLNMGVLAINRSMGCMLAVLAAMLLFTVLVLTVHKKYSGRVLTMILIIGVISAAAFALSSAIRDDTVLLIHEIAGILHGNASGYAGHGRWQLWTETAGFIRDHPLFGYGCEGIRNLLLDAAGAANPHNEVLAYAAFFGVPAAALYVPGVVAAITSGVLRTMDDPYKGIAALGATGYFISSMFGVGMFYTLPFFFVLLGMCCSNQYDGGEL